MFSGADAPWHWVIIAVLVIALFGYKKLPDASRALGRSLRIFKTEIKGLTEDDKARDAAATKVDPEPIAQAPVVATPPPAPATPPVVVETPAPAPVPVSTEHKPAE